MATKTFKGRIQNKHDTEVNWSAATNFRPLAGELIIYDEDDTHSTPRLKIGNGNTLVNNLPFIPTVSTLGQTGQLKDGVQDTTHRLVTETEKATWNNKQTQLTNVQLNAVNSGITANKVSTYDGYANAISNKVDKVTGKGLSTNDFTTAEKTKLAGIETGAQVNEIDTITAGSNVTVSKSGKTVTISATGGGGTAVVANPTLTGSETNLSGLQVGNTKYGIKALKVTIW